MDIAYLRKALRLWVSIVAVQNFPIVHLQTYTSQIKAQDPPRDNTCSFRELVFEACLQLLVSLSDCLPVLLLLPKMTVLSKGFDLASVVEKYTSSCMQELALGQSAEDTQQTVEWCTSDVSNSCDSTPRTTQPGQELLVHDGHLQ